jgi:hypothetical protein
MRRKILLIKGKGGLGNRILSAVCGLIYADLSGRTPVIDWRGMSANRVGERGGDAECYARLRFSPPIPYDNRRLEFRRA